MHTIVVDLGFGDAGKGTVVDWLCRAGPVVTVVRFNGGAQAAHNVVTPDHRHHTFSQFGAGSFVAGVRTHLSRFAVVEPLALAAEATHLRAVGVPDALDRLSVSGDALVTTPFHRAANRLREARRGDDRHGSCGVGVGETVRLALAHPGSAALRVGGLRHRSATVARLAAIRDALVADVGPGVLRGQPALEDLAEAYGSFARRVAVVGDAVLRSHARLGSIVFEGAQGVLLDEWRGFHPYTTWSTTTFANAWQLADDAGLGDVTRLGVVRAYQTRHGAGPLVTEDAGLATALPEAHNGTGPWQGPFRVGHLDLVALRYGLDASGGADALAVTHLDRVAGVPALRACHRYRAGDGRTTIERLPVGPPRDLDHQARLTEVLAAATPVLTAPTGDWEQVIEDAAGVPVTLTSRGPTAADKTGAGRRAPRAA